MTGPLLSSPTNFTGTELLSRTRALFGGLITDAIFIRVHGLHTLFSLFYLFKNKSQIGR